LKLKSDPGQVHNIYPTSLTQPEFTILGIPVSKVLPRLDALLMVTKSCKGHTCVHPWSVIHPARNVQTLKEALDTRFDNFYSSVSAAVSFEKCELGYILESEGPQEAIVFHEVAGENWPSSEEL
jgi:N-acetylglucosamine-6-sulfatase